MGERSGGACFASKNGDERGIVLHVLGEELQSDVTLQAPIPRAKDDAHSTAPDFAQDLETQFWRRSGRRLDPSASPTLDRRWW